MTRPTAKMICMHHDYVAANKRVSRSKRLLPYSSTILSHGGDTHWQFVCCAPISEIVQWAISQQLLEQRGQPERLSEIRNERRPNSRYASLDNCRQEVADAEAMMRREGIRWLSTTTKSIEEISTTILQEIRPDRPVY